MVEQAPGGEDGGCTSNGSGREAERAVAYEITLHHFFSPQVLQVLKIDSKVKTE